MTQRGSVGVYLVGAPSPTCPQAKTVQFRVENVSHADEYVDEVQAESNKLYLCTVTEDHKYY